MALSKHLEGIKELGAQRQLREELRVSLWKIRACALEAAARDYDGFSKFIREIQSEVAYAMEVYDAAEWPEKEIDGVKRIKG